MPRTSSSTSLIQLTVLVTLVWFSSSPAQVPPPAGLITDGVAPIPVTLKTDVARYLEYRTASFAAWHPVRREMLVATCFADTKQLHTVKMPGGARRQMTFSSEPIAGGSFQPRSGSFLVYRQDIGGGEFYQLYRYDPGAGKSLLLTDGKSRNGGFRWARSGRWLAYTSTRRNGRDTDIYVMDPTAPAGDRLLLQVTGGGWSVEDWSHDEAKLLVVESVSINQSHVHLVNVSDGTPRRLDPESATNTAFANPRFSADDHSVLLLTDAGSEFSRLAEYRLPVSDAAFSRPHRILSGDCGWDVEEFEVTDDGSTLAYVVNEGGPGTLHLMDVKSGKERRVSKLPGGVISSLAWHPNNRDLGFNISSARSPLDVYSLDVKNQRLERWTESETGGLDPAGFVEPELVRLRSFDGLEISAFIYRPDATRFPGKRPVLVSIHGGPEGQARPGFLGRNNYYLNELGVAIVYPNVRGSSGYGKTFLALDNGLKREDSVRDLGVVLDWVAKADGLDRDRVAVLGGSYGGYMVLTSLIHFNDHLRCGVDVVGISNFLTFLKNTQDYRRDLRRVEYGDEREPAMRQFLEGISPTTRVAEIRRPLLVVQGKNDPRVPLTESEQMVKAIRDNDGVVWYLMAEDEGHGFAKKKNADFQFLATVSFLNEYLLK